MPQIFETSTLVRVQLPFVHRPVLSDCTSTTSEGGVVHSPPILPIALLQTFLAATVRRGRNPMWNQSAYCDCPVGGFRRCFSYGMTTLHSGGATSFSCTRPRHPEQPPDFPYVITSVMRVTAVMRDPRYMWLAWVVGLLTLERTSSTARRRRGASGTERRRRDYKQ